MELIGYCFRPNEAFEGRNQAYGAFRLRKVYRQRMTAAVLGSTLLFSLGVASPLLFQALDPTPAPTPETTRVVEFRALELPPPEEPPPLEMEASTPAASAAGPPPVVSTLRFVAPEVAPDQEILAEEVVPVQDSLKEKQASTITAEGDPGADPNAITGTGNGTGTGEGNGEGTGGEGSGKGSGGAVVEESPRPVQFNVPDYPPEAQRRKIRAEVFVEVDLNEQGRVLESRIVRRLLLDKDGEVVEEVPVLGYGIEEAALTASRNWRFRPGRRNGVPVSSQYVVSFKLGVQ